jgi:hypothetical protein
MATLNNLDIHPTEKRDIAHDEHVDDKSIEQQLLKSRFDDMSIPRTLWIFRKSAFFVFLVYTGYFCEGFELQAGGLVIANRGECRC